MSDISDCASTKAWTSKLPTLFTNKSPANLPGRKHTLCGLPWRVFVALCAHSLFMAAVAATYFLTDWDVPPKCNINLSADEPPITNWTMIGSRSVSTGPFSLESDLLPDYKSDCQVPDWPFQPPNQNAPLFSPNDSKAFCRTQSALANSRGTVRVTELSTQRHDRRMFDVVLLNTELEMLELRMALLWGVVDKFVIIESGYTFSGVPKPRCFQLHKYRYANYSSRIVYVDADQLLNSANRRAGHDAWDTEHRIRQLSVRGSSFGARQHDVIILADVDELPTVDMLKVLKHCEGWRSPVCMHYKLFYVSFEFLSGDWVRGGIFEYLENIPEPNAEAIRRPKGAAAESQCMLNGGSHASYFFRNIRHFQNKFTSFSHQEYNKAKYKDPCFILDRVSRGASLFDYSESEGRPWSDPKLHAPQYVLNNSDRYEHMLNRKAWGLKRLDPAY